MDTLPIAELAAAVNWAIAYQGTGTHRIAQTYARRGNTVKTGVLVYTANAAQQVAQWRIPDTRGATEVLCYVHGSSVGGLGTFEFRSVTGGGVTGAQTLPAVADLVGPYTLAIDASGGHEEVRLFLDGSGGGGTADITIDSILVRVEPLASPLAAGIDSIGCVATDPAEYAAAEPLASDSGLQMRANLEALRAVPHCYFQWSGIANIADANAVYMRAVPHEQVALVWLDTADESWTLTIHAYATNAGGGDTYVRVNAQVGGHPRRTCTITVASGSGTGWHTGTLELPRGRTLKNLASGWQTVTISVWPIATGADAVSELERIASVDAEDMTTALVRSISVWGR